MTNITYTVNQDTPQSIPNVEVFSQEDTTLVNNFQLNQLFFKHSLNHFKRFYHPQVKLLEIQMDDSNLPFSVGKKSEVVNSIYTLN